MKNSYYNSSDNSSEKSQKNQIDTVYKSATSNKKKKWQKQGDLD